MDIQSSKNLTNPSHNPNPNPNSTTVQTQRSSASSSGRRRRSSQAVVPVSDVQCKDVALRFVRRKLPVLVCCIMALNIGMFMVTMYINNCPASALPGQRCFASFLGRFSFQPLKENPLLGPSVTALEMLGALDPKKVVHEHQGWRLLTCVWLHAGAAHILANMVGLLAVGIQLEHDFGFVKIGAIYLLSGFGASLLSTLFSQGQISVGASGAVFGLLGAMVSEIITNWTIYTGKCAAMATLLVIVVLNLAMGILPHVDNFAHIGGFTFGFLLGFVLLMKPQYGWMYRANLLPGDTQYQRTSKHKSYQYALLAVSTALLIIGFVAIPILVFRGVDANKKCSWCHYLSCVPTSKWKCNDSNDSPTCETSQLGNDLQLTCMSNNKTSLAPLDKSNSYLQALCSQLCS